MLGWWLTLPVWWVQANTSTRVRHLTLQRCMMSSSAQAWGLADGRLTALIFLAVVNLLVISLC